MFALGLLISVYGYGIFFLGILKLLYAPILWVWTGLFLISIGFILWKNTVIFTCKNSLKILKHDFIAFLLFLILLGQICVNFIGVLGPEIGFDALWYHLTLPKLYLLHHAIFHIPGGLLYYSDMPKFVELLYTGALSFGSPIFAKCIHFSFGLCTLIVLYKMSRKFLSTRWSLIALVIFYANLVVGWESISAYVDLGRTLFELVSLYAFILWTEKNEKKYIIFSALFMGVAITIKLLAIGSLAILSLLLIATAYSKKKTVFEIVKMLIVFIFLALIVPAPWFIFSFAHTGNPLYPFFTHTYPVPFPLQLFNPWYFFTSFWNLFLFSADPLNPIYAVILPLVIISYRKFPNFIKLLIWYGGFGLLFWYITPRTGGGRFVLPYLPILSLITAKTIQIMANKKIKTFLIIIVLFLVLLSLGYRALANAKFIPVILGKESTNQFLASHLNFSFGDFVDSDTYFAHHIHAKDMVLLYGFHNEFYVDFPFIDASWVQKGDKFNYIATQNMTLPKRFASWQKIYTNRLTHVTLYTDNKKIWTY